MRKLLSFLRWVLETFGSLLGFWIAMKLYGLVAGILVGAAIGLLAVGLEIARTKTVSRLTAFTAVSVVAFGLVDLKFQSARFIQLEPAVGNLLWAALFLGSVVSGKPLIVEIAEKARGVPLGKPVVVAYLRNATIAWGVFFIARASVYAWMAFHVTLGTALLIRGTIMPLSIPAMFGLEMAARYLKFGKRAFGARNEEAAVVAAASTGERNEA
jgi:intracellular septation protein A